MRDAYRGDLAFIHDSGFGFVAEAAGSFLLDRLRSARIDGGLVVELGSGSGILAAKLSDAGYDVLGIDISAKMIALARKRAPRACFRVGSLLDAEIPDCSAVASIGECASYLFDESNSDTVMRRLFRRVYDALRPGGLFIFDMVGPGRVPGGAKRSFYEGDDWLVTVVADEDPHSRLITRSITSFRRIGKLYRRDHEVHQLRLVPPADVLRELRAVGFKARVLRSYGDFHLPRGWNGFLARTTK